jgi:ADP-ribosylation factor GTPase-activating protein 1
MDTWQADQIKRMQVGNCMLAFQSSLIVPSSAGMLLSDSSSSHTRQQIKADISKVQVPTIPTIVGQLRNIARRYAGYRIFDFWLNFLQLDATLADKPWSPSAPPALSSSGSGTNSPARPSSAQGLRKSRALARNLTSPVSSASSPQPSLDSASTDQKSANEAFFSSLGQVNATRPADLPPSQGGRYQGFGNTPSPPTSQHPSFGLSSTSAPSLQDFQDNPGAALSKGWSLVSAVVAGASRVVNENVIQPGMERALDPNLHATVRGYMSEAQRRAQDAGRSANEWSKTQLGVDVADQVGGVVGTVKDRLGSGPQSSGYGTISMHNDGETSALYHDDTEDFFGEYSDGHTSLGQPSVHSTSGTSNTPTSKSKNDDWDEWKDFW